MSKIAKRLVLNDNHPTAIKVMKLMDLADELGLTISFSGQRVLIQDTDRDRGLPPLYCEDIEGEGHWFEEFPFTTEYRLVYTNPKYLEQLEQERIEREKAELAKAAAEYDRLKAKKQEEEARQARLVEARERQQLADLKAKYGE
jgi:hypothetical protein